MTNESVIRLFNAIDSSDWEMLKTLFHEDIVYERPGYPPFTDRDRVLQFYKSERIIASASTTSIRSLRYISDSVYAEPREGETIGRDRDLVEQYDSLSQHNSEVVVIPGSKHWDVLRPGKRPTGRANSGPSPPLQI